MYCLKTIKYVVIKDTDAITVYDYDLTTNKNCSKMSIFNYSNRYLSKRFI